MKSGIRTLAVAIAMAISVPAMAVDVASFVKRDQFDDIKISPTGAYFAATVPLEDRTMLAILDRANNKMVGQFVLGKNTLVSDFEWVNDERVVISMAEKFGALARPVPTGELYAINADGSQADLLVGFRVAGQGLGTKIQPKKVEAVAAWVVDALPNDDRNILVGVAPFAADPYTRVERMDVNSGRRVAVARAPVRRASFVTDNAGIVRFATGAGVDNALKTFYRSANEGEWQLINDEDKTGLKRVPIGFSLDGKVAYLEAEQKTGPNVVLALDTATLETSEVLRDDNTDPADWVYRNGTQLPIGAVFHDGEPRTSFIVKDAPEARLQRSLEAAFAGHAVSITSQTADGKVALVHVSSASNPGDFYLFDTVQKKASHLLSRRDWFDPDKMATVKPIDLKSRDGLALHGYLTLPRQSTGKDLPLVVMPHGGPFGVQDTWTFDDDAQLLAQAGYAVLQLNFRGSSGYGRAFNEAGARQWGGTMQDDVTDATRWAVAQGIADRNRVCIYGASYGAYAALMGVAKEPDLYKCAAGYVGVYDLPTMHTQGDIQERGSGETFLNEWIGPRAELGATSPSRLADRIKAAVFLAAGGEDQRAPIEHSEMMERALKKAGVPVETLYYPNEGHGFYKEEHRREYYTRLLAFLSRHLGGKVATSGSDPKPRAN